ncbi:MAG: hypothetical protein MI919_32570 [Holophagales bacterium]|nr:hypothetical protein [Holophagales bacterium]
MGTFHDDKHELHGITVVVETEGSELYVGRCDDMDADRVILLDVDVHREGEGELSRREYLERASQWGVFPKHRRLVVDRGQVTDVRRLGEL